ncbi:hypothetical protein FACS1894186_0940 [Alphaproteobacteria bacterium]|nr:hypothetical protein FACS1894186_0940 [Alphaproteobacteria bacterium]
MRGGRALVLAAAIAAVAACAAVKNRRLYALMWEETRQNRYDAALAMLDDEAFYGPDSALLTAQTRGQLLYLKGDWDAAAHELDRAGGLADSLYTVSVGSKLKAAAASEASDIYYGSPLESSMTRYYALLAHAHLAQDTARPEAERRASLDAAGAVARGWGAMLAGVKNEGKEDFRASVLASVAGAAAQAARGAAEGAGLARSLWKAAGSTLASDYGAYPSLAAGTAGRKALEAFLKDAPKAKDGGFLLFVADRPSPPLRAELVEIPLPISLAAAGISAKEKQSFAEFLPSLAAGTTIAFETPAQDKPDPSLPWQVELVPDGGQVMAAKADAPVVEPVAEIAWRRFDSGSAARTARLTARLTAKHAAAIAAAYLLWKQMGGSQAGALAALLSYHGAAAAIAESERADTRGWATLPRAVRVARLAGVPAGRYTARLYEDGRLVAVRPVEIPEGAWIADANL